ncbi:MAG: hypothetical protein WBM24_12885 [Candidatus Sulfotelmatobacter sp.]
MKFADKYELSDAVTSGRLETFLGRDVGSGERVLVHIFDAPAKQPGQPTVMWALESFRAIAPEAPGLVIAAGRYGGTSYAYLVTRVPDEAALQRWKQTYESSTAETRELPVMPIVTPPTPPASAAPRPNAEVVAPTPLSKPPNPPTGFFGLRQPIEASGKPTDQGVKPAEKNSEIAGDDNDLEGINFGRRQEPKGREPGEFTKQFFVGSSEPRPASAGPVASGRVAPLPVESVPVEPVARALRKDQIAAADSTRSAGPSPSPHGALPEFGGFTSLFSPGPKSESAAIKSAPSRNDAPRTADDAKSGDFTNFFQGPFDGERPSEIPNVSTNLTSTSRGKVPGEFTQMFGAVKDNPFATPSSSGPVEEPPLRTEPESFTRSFADPVSPGGETRGNGNQKPAASVEPKWTQPLPPPVVFPADPPEPAVPRASKEKPRESRPSVQGGATQLFSVPGGHSAPSPPSPPSGPSEYTRIISGGMLGLNSSTEQAAEEGPAAGGLPTFKMPAAAAPPPPKIAAPPAPKLPKMPPAPKIPPVGALLPKPKSSYLPMIIILNVSLIIAVLLIVYFAIRH